MAIEGNERRAGRSAWAWWAAARAPSSARCIGSPRAWTINTSSWRARCRPTPARAKRLGPRNSASPPTRIYTDFREMAKAEAGAQGRHRGGGDRHAEPHACPGRRWPSSRPASMSSATSRWRINLKEAQALAEAAARKNRSVIFALTHNYSGYPMIRQAKAMVAAGELGEIRVVQGEYPQDWLTNRSRRPARSRPPGAPTRSRPAPAAASATSAPTPISSCAMSRA